MYIQTGFKRLDDFTVCVDQLVSLLKRTSREMVGHHLSSPEQLSTGLHLRLLIKDICRRSLYLLYVCVSLCI